MSKLTLYILREFLIPLFYCLVGFIGIYVLFELFGSFSRLLSSDLSFKECVLYFGGYLSPFFHYLASAAMMLATLYTMWNFCRHSELTAMRASGISLLAVVKPLLFAGALMGGIIAWVSESYMPEYAQWAKKLKSERFGSKKVDQSDAFSFANTKDNRTWMVTGGANRDYTELLGVSVDQETPEGLMHYNITAEKASFMDGEWWFTNPKIQHYSRGSQCASPIPEIDALTLRAFPQFSERPKDICMQQSNPKYLSVSEKLNHIKINHNLTDDARREFKYDAWSQVLAPLSCIIVMLFSIPAGITSGRQSVFEGILGSIGMFFVFHGLSIACMVLVRCNLISPIPASLIPTIFFLSIGIFYFRNSLKATLNLMVSYLVLFALYILSAALLASKCGLGETISHLLALILPVVGGILLTLRLNSKA
jgi:lipopolysaccharide export system permease protein